MAYPSALTLSTRGEGFRLTLHCRLKLQSPSCVAVKEMSTGSLQGREGRGGEREGRGGEGSDQNHPTGQTEQSCTDFPFGGMVPFMEETCSCAEWPVQWQLCSTKSKRNGEDSLFSRYTVSDALEPGGGWGGGERGEEEGDCRTISQLV